MSRRLIIRSGSAVKNMFAIYLSLTPKTVDILTCPKSPCDVCIRYCGGTGVANFPHERFSKQPTVLPLNCEALS